MEAGILYLLSGLLGLGYYLNKDGRVHIGEIKQQEIPENEKPSGLNIYSSRHIEKVWDDEYKKMTKNWKDSKNPEKTNIVPEIKEIFNKKKHIYTKKSNNNKKMYGRKIIQNENNITRNYEPYRDTSASNTVKKISNNLLDTENVIDYGTKSINEKRRNLTGLLPINESKDEVHGGWNNFFPNVPSMINDISKFHHKEEGGKGIKEYKYHNNMEPFFGGSIKQNMDPNLNKTRLETFTGGDPIYSHKKEVKRFFPIEKNPYIHGLPVKSNRELERYIPSNLGLKRNVLPFEQVKVPPGLNKDAKSLKTDIGFHDNYRPQYKTTNELRVNPKSNYKGRVVGKKFYVSHRTNIAPVESRRPVDISYTNDPNDKTRIYRENISNTLGGIQKATDLDRKAIVFKTQERDMYADKIKDHSGPAIGQIKKDYTVPKMRISNKPTYKSEIISAKAETNKSYNVPNTKISNKPTYKITSRFVKSGKYAGQNYNEDNAKITIKEQNIERKNPYINISAYKDMIAKPLDSAKITTKQQFIDNKHGHININTYKTNTIYDKENWAAKTTNKEQLIDENVTANVAGSHKYKNSVYFLDKSKTTQKEQLVGENVTANIGKSQYRNTSNPFDDARITIKQQISDINVTPNVDSGNQHRHITNPLDDARITIKQQTESHTHSHINPDADTYKPKDRENVYNAEINALKELTIESREPVQEGTKISPDKELYNIESKKLQYNTFDKTRRIGKVWEPTTNIKSEITAQSQFYNDKAINNDRINPDILTPFKNNPYTQSLQSYAYQYNPTSLQ